MWNKKISREAREYGGKPIAVNVKNRQKNNRTLAVMDKI